ncbi:MAG: flagellar motor protein [Thermodesulfovibrionales bacterium]|nr:flagellar motor protein [Thermodesulfovibrionales bacterium]
MDRASIIGIILGIAAIVGGNISEGGKIHSIVQMTAALIVFGGTLGATLLSFPFADVMKAFSSLRWVFFESRTDPELFISEITRYSFLARRHGLIAMEQHIAKIDDQFFRRALRLAIDGMGPKTLRETMEQENITYEDENKRIAKVFDTAGGFAPTIGIIGAVLGLIHVMENLSDPSKLGSGIAVAFVATIYGVGSANLILLPIAKKLVHRLNNELLVREMILEGVMGILSGINPHYLEERLRSFIAKGV